MSRSRANHPLKNRKRKKTQLLGLLFSLNVLLLSGFILWVVREHHPPAAALTTTSSPAASPARSLIRPSPTSSRPPHSSPTAIPPSQTSSPTPTSLPTRTPTPPAEVFLQDIHGHHQSLPLSCEASSAVDWAAYFGFQMDEEEFFSQIPASDNPEKGFVGDVQGKWGQIPPDPYGVHAPPVARVLRRYGIPAQARKDMTLSELKTELAAGRPVIVWVVSHVYRGTPVPYTASDGETTTVAQFEHTVIVIGYNRDKWAFLDGNETYQRYEKEFLRSWEVLGRMGIVFEDGQDLSDLPEPEARP